MVTDVRVGEQFALVNQRHLDRPEELVGDLELVLCLLSRLVTVSEGLEEWMKSQYTHVHR